jgi:hypothetical protein
MLITLFSLSMSQYTMFLVPVSPLFTLVLTVEFTNDMKMGVEEEVESDRLARTRIFPNGTHVKGDIVYETTKNS